MIRLFRNIFLCYLKLDNLIYIYVVCSIYDYKIINYVLLFSLIWIVWRIFGWRVFRVLVCRILVFRIMVGRGIRMNRCRSRMVIWRLSRGSCNVCNWLRLRLRVRNWRWCWVYRNECLWICWRWRWRSIIVCRRVCSMRLVIRNFVRWSGIFIWRIRLCIDFMRCWWMCGLFIFSWFLCVCRW